MEATTSKQLVIDKLLSLNTKVDKALTLDSLTGNLEITKSKVQDSLDQVSKHKKFYEIGTYILLSIVLVVSFIKALGISEFPDLNKGGLVILSTATFSLKTFEIKKKIEIHKMRIMLLEILESFNK